MTNRLLRKSTHIILFDEESHFTSDKVQTDIKPNLFKNVELIKSSEALHKYLNEEVKDDDKVAFFVHIFSMEDLKGYHNFEGSEIKDDFPNLKVKYLSKEHHTDVSNKIKEQIGIRIRPFQYFEINDQLGDGINPQSKFEILGKDKKGETESIKASPSDGYPQIDFALITALYEDEFEKVKPFFNWNKAEDFDTKEAIFKIGSLKGNDKKKIVAVSAKETGMIDSAILTTQLLEFFRPKILFMTGVCGGKSSLDFGDIVVATKIFTFQKGKLSDILNSDGEKSKILDKNKDEVDINKFTDEDGNMVTVSIEKFEVEHDSMIEMNGNLKQRIEQEKDKIIIDINKELLNFKEYAKFNKVKIIMESMACSTMVINKQDFFEQNVKNIHRKTAALEMESYGVARACQFANNGETKFIVFKAVMDNMKNKDDDAKSFAAHSSALFLKYLLKNDIF